MLAALIVIIMLAAFIVNVLRLADAAGPTSYNHPLDLTPCGVLPLAPAALAGLLWGAGYTLGQGAASVNF